MLRAFITALALMFAPVCASAQINDETRADAPIVRATAQVMIAALAPSDYGAWAYQWDAVSIRVSRLMHWHLFAPDDRDRPPDAISRRNGWISEEGRTIGVSAFGLDDRVIKLTFEVNAFHTLYLLEALRAEGVEVSFQGEDESSSEYVITPPGREEGMLTSTRICTSPQSRAAQRCHNEITLAFELP
jgi:hypothetical protein